MFGLKTCENGVKLCNIREVSGFTVNQKVREPFVLYKSHQGSSLTQLDKMHFQFQPSIHFKAFSALLNQI